jgi:methionine sulfoxide reductase catalytic subunit
MLIKKPSDIAPSEITPRAVWQDRRRILQALTATAAAAPLGAFAQQRAKLSTVKSKYVTMEKITPAELSTTYNNYYEFGTDKADPGKNAGTLKTKPWTVSLEGACNKPQTIGIEDILKIAPLEERVYRLRCVEGWSMVIPWVGFSLSELIKRAEPAGNAKFIEFVTLNDAKQMPGLRSPVLEWPYTEALRMDEAMQPLALLTLGAYGEILPNQMGAPVRLIVPWKYGFKSGKSIVKIRFVEKQPKTSWEKAGPSEYGFYSNVNPDVDHPRWSQATERRIDSASSGLSAFITPKRKTLLFNGYDEVAPLYAGMDLRKFF